MNYYHIVQITYWMMYVINVQSEIYPIEYQHNHNLSKRIMTLFKSEVAIAVEWLTSREVNRYHQHHNVFLKGISSHLNITFTCSSGLTNTLYDCTRWRHQMETFSALLAICAGSSPVTGEFPAQRPLTRNFDVSFFCAGISGLVNNREAGDLRRHRAHYDVIVKRLYNWNCSSYKLCPAAGRICNGIYFRKIDTQCSKLMLNRCGAYNGKHEYTVYVQCHKV